MRKPRCPGHLRAVTRGYWHFPSLHLAGCLAYRLPNPGQCLHPRAALTHSSALRRCSPSDFMSTLPTSLPPHSWVRLSILKTRARTLGAPTLPQNSPGMEKGDRKAASTSSGSGAGGGCSRCGSAGLSTGTFPFSMRSCLPF